MNTAGDPTRFYWTRHTDGHGRWRRADDATGMPPGADLAQLRRGLGREPGSVPEMWRFHTTMNHTGALTPWFRAEHHALGLFALHQQSQGRPMHRAGAGLGTAMRALLDHDNAGAEGGTAAKRDRIDAVDRRFAAAATAGSPEELVLHLRGLIIRLRGITQGLDYTWLYNDLTNWADPERSATTRRRWGMQYFVDQTPNTASTASTSKENQ